MEWVLVGLAATSLAVTILGARAWVLALRRRRRLLEGLQELREAKSRRLDSEATQAAIASWVARGMPRGRPRS